MGEGTSRTECVTYLKSHRHLYPLNCVKHQ